MTNDNLPLIHRISRVALAVAGLCLSGEIRAQTVASADGGAHDGQMLPSIAVIGKREHTLDDMRPQQATVGVLGERGTLETPFSMNVLGRALIDTQQAATVQDLLKNDPSVVVSNVPVGFLTLRGFALGNDGVLYDGMPGHYGLTDARGVVEFVDRVEVLKGAASFLYGMGSSPSLGGTMNYIPKPLMHKPVRAGSLTWTSRSQFGLSADLADRFGSERQFGWRVNLAGKAGEQQIEGYDWKQRAASLAFDWRITPQAVLTLRHDDAHTELPRLQPFFALGGVTRVPEAPDASSSLAQPWDRFVVDSRNSYARLDWTLAPDWQVTTQVLHNRHRRPDVLNARFGVITDDAGNVAQFGDQSHWGVDTTSANVLLRGKLQVAGMGHELTIGANSGRDKTFGQTGDPVNGGAPYITNLYAPVRYDAPARVNNQFIETGRSRFSSVLLSDIVSFNEQWSVLLGARHGQISEATVPDSKVTRTSPAGALMFKPGRDSLVYLNYAEGLERGGVAPSGGTITNADRRLGPLVTRQVELGAKLDYKGLGLAAAAFDMRRPAEYLRNNGDLTSTYVQDGLQRHRGVELTAAGRLAAGWHLMAGAMWLDPKSVRTGNPAHDGKRPVGVPTSTANVWVSHDLAALPGLSLNGGVFHSSGQFADAANTLRVPAWTRLDVGARYELKLGGARYSVIAGVENVTDRSYWTGAQSGLLVLSNPRTYKLSLRAEL